MDEYEVICIKGWLHISNDKTFILKKINISNVLIKCGYAPLGYCIKWF